MPSVSLTTSLRARAFAVTVSLGLAVSCGLPHYSFEPNAELPAHCQNNHLDQNETGVDCGGPECAACGVGVSCLRDSDCSNSSCVDSACQDPSCANHKSDPGETDLDCGGSSCKPCSDGANCQVASDCVDKNCIQQTCVAATCSDKIQNGDEIATDCGGSCPGCGEGTTCVANDECASGDCHEGKCGALCQGSTAECDGDYRTQCETNLKTDPDHCGACNTPCQLDHALPSCSGGVCKIASCTPPYGDCDGNPTNGCETNLNSTAEHCGTCEVECSSTNGDASCSGGKCSITCNGDSADCDPQMPGCETETANNVNHCGSCSTVCTGASGETPFCTDGVCGATTCPANRGNCNGDAGDSCEADLLTNPDHCGACGNKCLVEHGTPGCVKGKCVVLGCDSHYGNCDTDAADGGYATGCETNTDASQNNCGACGTRCTIDNSSSECVAGNCQVKTCNSGYLDCDDNPSDCEVNALTDSLHCGGCDVDCTKLFANASGECVAGSCRVKSCNTNFDSCDNDPTTCEVDLRSDAAHCGDCMTACKTTNTSAVACKAGVCAPTCTDGFGHCADPSLGCLDRLDTPQNCGACGTNCSGDSAFCVNGKCGGVVLVNATAKGSSSSGTLTIAHTLASAKNQGRLLLVAVASLASTAAKAQPKSIVYGANKTPLHALESATPYGTPQSFTNLYYLLDSELPDPGNQTLTIDNSGAGETVRTGANVIEFVHVDQTMPLSSNKFSGLRCVSNYAQPVSIAVSGSYLFDIEAGEWWTTDPGKGPAGLTQTMNLVENNAQLRAVGGYRGPLAATASISTGFGSSDNCNSSSHYVAIVRPGN